MRIHEFITYLVKLLLSTRCRGAGVLCMAAEDVWKKSCCYRPWGV